MALPAITSYDTLVLNMADYLARDDLTQYFPTFIGQAEARLETRLKVPGMETETSIDSNNANTYPLPADYVEWIRAIWFNPDKTTGQGLRNVEANSPEATYRYRPNGNPMYYIATAGAIRVVPTRPGSLLLTYYRTLPRLSPTVQTNWLIQRAPQVYLTASLAEAYAFQKDADRTIEWMQAMDKRLEDFIEESAGNKVGRRVTRDAEVAAEVNAAKAIV